MAINFGLLRDLPQQQYPDMIGSIGRGIDLVQAPQMKAAQIEEARQRGALTGVQARAAQEDLNILPEMNQLKLQGTRNDVAFQPKHQQAQLAQLAANTGLTNTHTKQAQQQIALTNLGNVNSSLGALSVLPPEQRQQAWDQTRQNWARAGLDPNILAETPSPAAVQQARVISGQYTQELANSIKMQEVSGQKAFNVDQAKALNDYKVESLDAARAANAILTDVDMFMAHQAKVPTGTGPLAGYLSPLSAQGRAADKAANRIVANMLPLMKGRITNNELLFLQKSNLSTSNPEKTNQIIAGAMRAVAGRAKQKQKFILAAQRKGLNDPTMIDGLWNEYISANPLINVENGDINKGNISNWQSTLSDKSIKSFASGGMDGFVDPAG